ncbi:hypothetical protein HMPREF1051_1089 [Neisseria sicca VK64]|uniref:Uncharacterized protein n=1 Tax=Neisseria sicca VK64 TaxID=1095748 RepID=I2NKS0_NEISI|nr:hypothetical protein HMPREF1051_1089 [Neisseria sicca VK64]
MGRFLYFWAYRIDTLQMDNVMCCLCFQTTFYYRMLSAL